jgi:ankyrin repeat protein
MSKRFLLTLILSGVTVLVLSGCGADANIEAKDSYGETPLHNTAFTNSLDVARLLIDRGADIEAKNDFDGTPLDATAANNSLDVARLLIDHGANTEGIDLSWMN